MSTETTLPPASFSTLVRLGKVPDPQTNQPVVRLPLAKHFIDSLEVIQEKTKGNLSDVESGMLESMLFELRMLYVAAQKKA